RAIGAEEDDVAIDNLKTLHELQYDIGRHELDDRRLQTFNALGELVDLDPRQTFRTVDRHEVAVIVDLCACQLRTTARYFQRCDAAFRIVGGTIENLEINLFHQVRDIDQLQRNAQVRLVAAVAVHRLAVGHARKGCELDIQYGLEQIANHALRSEEHTSELQSRENLVCRLLLEKKK